MGKTSSIQSKAARSIRMACGFLFISFSVVYLLFQGHVLEMVQKVLSEGQTTYSPAWGTCIITFILCLVQMGVSRLIHIPERAYALSYVPSLLLLAWITDFDHSMYQGMSIGLWIWLMPVGLMLWGLSIGIAHLLHRLSENRLSNDWFSYFGSNLLIFVMLGILTVTLGNTKANFHAEVAVESALLQGDYGKAIQVAAASRSASRELTVLRAYALSRVDSLPDKLFAYPQYYGAQGLLFDRGEARTTWLTADEIYQYLGNAPRKGESGVDFLRRSCYAEIGNRPILDYYLCALLLRKELPVFVRELHTFCYVDDVLPRAYREALYLYYMQHPTSDGMPIWEGAGESYEAYRSHPEQHRDTYWYYYDHIPMHDQ